ncbi:MAG TPA: FG-GAP-like repeat-containing protein [Bryobacteraceae bacterium]|nr:FG-GAP-like repeat-containing protein [Bryobacteraceae bacterium]
MPGTVVKWNGKGRPTAFVNSSEVTATILASDLRHAGTAFVTATNPAPGGGTSNVAWFEISPPGKVVAFSNSSTYTVPGAVTVVAADLNGDGKLDLIVGNLETYAVVVLLGNGDGTFQRPQSFPTGNAFPISIAVGDFNKDGKPDIAAATSYDATGSDYLAVLLGNGDGTFQPFQSYPVDPSPRWISAGDFNEDGNLDVAVSICPPGNAPYCGGPSTVGVLLGNGDGTFQQAVDYAAGPSVNTVVTGDFNGDGHLDLAVSGFPNGSLPSGISVLLGNGDGSFQTPTFLSGPYFYLTTADMNQDGILDLVAVADNTVSVMFGNGDGTFAMPVSYTAGEYLVSVAVGDFNADGNLDLAVLDCVEGPHSSSSIYMLLGNGDGTWRSPIRIPATNYPSAQLGGLVPGDFNGDGRIDLTSAQSNGNGTSSNVIATYLQTTALVNPMFLSFPTTVIGTASQSQSLTVTNIGRSPLNISLVTLTGTYPTDFNIVGNTCQGAVVQPAGQCAITVTFSPAAQGFRSAWVTIADSGLASPEEVLLSGSGTVVEYSPTHLTFGSANLGTASSAQTVTLTNTGAASIGDLQPSLAGTNSGDFLESTTCGNKLAPGASCSILVTFQPTATGTRTAVLNIQEPGGGGSPLEVALMGTGT